MNASMLHIHDIDINAQGFSQTICPLMEEPLYKVSYKYIFCAYE